MITQRISPAKLSPLKGFILVLEILALLLAATIAVNVAQNYMQPIWPQLAVLALAGLGAYYLMRRYVLEFQYTVNEGMFYIERLYGQRTKILLSVGLSDILFVGDQMEAAAKWPGKNINLNATVNTPDAPEKVCFVYRSKAQVFLGLIQPNEEILNALKDTSWRRNSDKEKWG